MAPTEVLAARCDHRDALFDNGRNAHQKFENALRVDSGEQRCSALLWANTRKRSHSPAKRRIKLKIGQALPLDGAFRFSHRGIESAHRFKRT